MRRALEDWIAAETEFENWDADEQIVERPEKENDALQVKAESAEAEFKEAADEWLKCVKRNRLENALVVVTK